MTASGTSQQHPGFLEDDSCFQPVVIKLRAFLLQRMQMGLFTHRVTLHVWRLPDPTNTQPDAGLKSNGSAALQRPQTVLLAWQAWHIILD